jgi:hypothetical protein
MFSYYGSLAVINSAILGNSAGRGGGVKTSKSDLTLINRSTISRNIAGRWWRHKHLRGKRFYH